MRRFEYFAPQSLAEAVALLRERGDGVRVLAGGTDLVVQIKEAGLHPSAVVSLHALDELRGITGDAASGLRIGARALMSEIEAHPVVRERYTALSDGAGVVGSVQTRNLATLGGNVCNAAPSADTSPALVVLDAVAEIAGANGTREVAVQDIGTGPGATSLAKDEIAVAFRLPPLPATTGSVYQRHTPRKIMDIAAVGVAVRLTLAGDAIAEARICLGAVAPTIIRVPDVEQALAGQQPSDELFARAAELAQAAARPISDTRGSAEFRRYLVGVMMNRCLGIALERARAGS
ncbi:MAG: xanthine dehydrogenase family protein subunit M [Dehalococcoidia bacterium]